MLDVGVSGINYPRGVNHTETVLLAEHAREVCRIFGGWKFETDGAVGLRPKGANRKG